MGGTVYAIPRAAELAGTIPSAVEDFLRVTPTAAISAKGQKWVTEDGMTLLQAYARGISEARASRPVEDENDPRTWSDSTIRAKGKKLADSIRGTTGSLLETTMDVRIRG